MARLMDGYERSRRSRAARQRPVRLGIITALFHDIGYLRHRKDTRHRNGAEYTLRHVSRGAYFLEEYMRDIGMPDWSRVAGRIIHFTGYEVPVERIDVPKAAVPLARQHARQRGHHCADGRSLLPGEMSRPAVSGVRLGRARCRAGSRATQADGAVHLAAGSAVQDARLLPHRDGAAGRASRRGILATSRSISAARTCTWTKVARTSAMPSGSREGPRYRRCLRRIPPPEARLHPLRLSMHPARPGSHARRACPRERREMPGRHASRARLRTVPYRPPPARSCRRARPIPSGRAPPRARRAERSCRSPA